MDVLKQFSPFLILLSSFPKDQTDEQSMDAGRGGGGGGGGGGGKASAFPWAPSALSIDYRCNRQPLDRAIVDDDYLLFLLQRLLWPEDLSCHQQERQHQEQQEQ